MNMLGPTDSTLNAWALNHDDHDVAEEAARSLAHRDKSSGSMLEFIARWLPKEMVTVDRFERFACAWEIVQREKALAQVKSEVPVPADLSTAEG